MRFDYWMPARLTPGPGGVRLDVMSGCWERTARLGDLVTRARA
jgi:hypothetical protein